MRKSRYAAAKREGLITAAASILAGIGALTITAAIMSAFASIFDLPDNVISAMSGIALAAGCYFCTFCFANRRRSGGLISGIFWGIGVFTAVLAAGLFTVRIFSAEGAAIKLLIILSASAIGGIKGVNARPFLRR